MNKRFNTTGVCVHKKHYMVDINNKLNQIEKLVNEGSYFIINRPRQYGKTTTLNSLKNRLKDKYIIINISFEGIGDLAFENEILFSNKFIKLIIKSLRISYKNESEVLKELSNNINDLDDVSDVITEFIEACDKDVILLIDEVDKFSNNQLFLSFLGMLRNKYLNREMEMDYTFKSVILAGVHDIKNLKLKLRDNTEKKLNSPWNIAVDFKVDMSFDVDEIKTMIDEYSIEHNLEMDTYEISKLIYYYTSGYPFLVSRICKIIDEEILKEKTVWKNEDIINAVKIILKENNTLFDDLVKNLENSKELNDYIFGIVFNGSIKLFNIDNPLIAEGVLYGIVKEEDGILKISNRIFEQRIYNYFISKLQNNVNDMATYNFRDNFINEDKSLDMNKILLKFQQFIKEQYSHKDAKFIEREGRILFLAFIKPIINGVGFDFREAQIAQEKRLDVVITYNEFKYVIELKVWYGKEYHEKGLNQLSAYIDNQGLDKGYLIVYNFNKNKEYNSETIEHNNKELFVVYV